MQFFQSSQPESKKSDTQKTTPNDAPSKTSNKRTIKGEPTSGTKKGKEKLLKMHTRSGNKDVLDKIVRMIFINPSLDLMFYFSSPR